MRFPTLLALVAASVVLQSNSIAAEPADKQCYEMRIYSAAPGKLEPLHQRFRDHTLRLFKKHNITSIGYWTPVDNKENKLYFLLSYADRDARETAWKAFAADADWTKAKADSEKDGTLVTKADVMFLAATDFSPKIEVKEASPRVFELRTYTTTPGNQERLLSRFRDHTVALFSKHGMSHFGYWTPMADQPGAANTLIYLLTHKSKEAAAESFKAFRVDPDWAAARTASEKAGGGSLTVAEGGVKSLFLQATDYSPTK